MGDTTIRYLNKQFFKKLWSKTRLKARKIGLYLYVRYKRSILPGTLTTTLIGFIGLFLGLMLNPGTQMSVAPQSYHIDGWNIHIKADGHPDMEGKVGYTPVDKANTIYLESGRTPVETYRTCVHEILHNKRPNMDHPEHDWWYNQEEKTYNEVCIKLLGRMEAQPSILQNYHVTRVY